MNTLILLIDFEGFNKLQDQNYLNKRYVALMNILNQRNIDRDKCIVVFNHVNIKTSAEKARPCEGGYFLTKFAHQIMAKQSCYEQYGNPKCANGKNKPLSVTSAS